MASKPRILVVDDEPVVRESLYEWFSEDGYPIEMAESGPEALRKMEESNWDILLTDVKMPGMDGLELQQKAKEVDPDITIIMMTAYASVGTAVQAIDEGAYDYVTKPLDPDDLQRIINRAAERRELLRENIQLRERIEAVSVELDEIIGDSPEIGKVRELVDSVAHTEAWVLISGEAGTGKELVARSIHGASLRRHMPLVTINCTGLTESQIEGELFGHEAGAFPGAQYRQKGRLELADGGTIFFENIGHLSPKTQADLQRALEEKAIQRLGGREDIPVDVRVIAATRRDLSRAVSGGEFRSDLYRQISASAIRLPPLRERRSDIPLLARYFLERAASDGRGSARRISTAAMQVMMDYPWPGNVRELRTVVERASALDSDKEIEPRDLSLGPPEEVLRPSELSLAEVEKQHIRNVLLQVSGNVAQAAQILQIDESTLTDRMRKYGLSASPD